MSLYLFMVRIPFDVDAAYRSTQCTIPHSIFLFLSAGPATFGVILTSFTAALLATYVTCSPNYPRLSKLPLISIFTLPLLLVQLYSNSLPHISLLFWQVRFLLLFKSLIFCASTYSAGHLRTLVYVCCFCFSAVVSRCRMLDSIGLVQERSLVRHQP